MTQEKDKLVFWQATIAIEESRSSDMPHEPGNERIFGTWSIGSCWWQVLVLAADPFEAWKIINKCWPPGDVRNLTMRAEIERLTGEVDFIKYTPDREWIADRFQEYFDSES